MNRYYSRLHSDCFVSNFAFLVVRPVRERENRRPRVYRQENMLDERFVLTYSIASVPA